jgi:hypothetical protein
MQMPALDKHEQRPFSLNQDYVEVRFRRRERFPYEVMSRVFGPCQVRRFSTARRAFHTAYRLAGWV